MHAGRVCIEEHDEKRCFVREIVDKLQRFTASWIGQCATGACLAHLFHVGVHPRPIEAQTKAVERPVGVQVAANSICVECNNTMFMSSVGTNCSRVNDDVLMIGS